MVQVVGSRDLLAARRARRGTERDQHRPSGVEPPPAAVPALRVDAELPTRTQLKQVLADLGVTGG
jgi:hypothetical protein